MDNNITFDYSKLVPFLKEGEISHLQPFVSSAHQMLHDKTGAGSDYTGWVDWPISHDKREYKRIKQTASYVKNKADVFLVIGIGGSYLGAKAAIEMLTHTFHNQLPVSKKKAPDIIFAGHNLSTLYMTHLFDLLEGKDVVVNVISKSGMTTEPAIAFRMVKKFMEQKYGRNNVKDRIIVTTDKEKGALKRLADEEGYETFVIPDDIGGRYSVLTSVGLLPIAVAGIDIDEVMAGARAGYEQYLEEDLQKNPCYQYAVVRNVLYNKGKHIELFVHYEPSLQYFSEWWKQLYGESEGKDNKGIFPASVSFTTDLHSMGQYIQEGRRNLFETTISIQQNYQYLMIEEDENNLDGLNYLTGKSLHDINQQAMLGTILAHIDGGIPNVIIKLPQLSSFYFGQLVYFFEKACGISGYLLGVNPFNQPGVEEYKKNMFALLGKPGFEEEQERLLKQFV
ncbi:glucose-6-phosphate isomerase [Anaerobacillus sp. MEB173]|uniref:glucose-6-phosphate isomerase n=1 Tax=Anaerobacillus sp. MEB173 TaxID=3383345 RepID=UPI003F8EF222